MDSTLDQLRSLLVQAIPTILFFILLTLFLRAVFFRPIARILAERRKATEGVRELARQAMEAAGKRSNEFETALDLARSQIQHEIDAQRKVWLQEQAQQVAAARTEAEKSIEHAKLDIANEVRQAEADLDAHIGALASEITESLLRRRAA